MRLSLLLSFFIGLSSNGYAQGVDLNPALLGCIMSGGACFMEIPFVNQFFGVGAKTPMHNDESFCENYIIGWCKGHAGYPSGYELCREAKKAFYKAGKQKLGEWNPPTGQKPNDYRNWTEEDYFKQIEQSKYIDERGYWITPKPAPYFACTPRQEYIWLKKRCSHTQNYRRFYGWNAMNRDHTEYEWSVYKTKTCGN